MHVIELGFGAISLSIIVVRCDCVDARLLNVLLYRSELDILFKIDYRF